MFSVSSSQRKSWMSLQHEWLVCNVRIIMVKWIKGLTTFYGVKCLESNYQPFPSTETTSKQSIQQNKMIP